MARQARVAVGGVVYHVINRSNGRVRIFDTSQEYAHFESLLLEGVELTGMRILAYTIMPNHWHLVLYPSKDGQMSEFMRWVTTTHVRQVRAKTGTIGSGHLYQNAYKSFPIGGDKYLVDVIRYVEQNPLRAHLVSKAEEWKWSSLFNRKRDTEKSRTLLAPLPTELPVNYLESVNTILQEYSIKEIRHAISKGAPFGSEGWTEWMVQTYNMQGSQRGTGRPKKK